MKTEVYSWRVDAEVKSDLKREARLRKVSMSALLDTVVRDWLKRNNEASDAQQRRIRKAVEKYAGVLSDVNLPRSDRVREAVRERLRQRYGR